MTIDHYALLNIPREADQEEIREAYFTLARAFHPDVNPDPQTAEKFIAIQNAYQVLSNPDLRNEYDLTLPPAPQKPDVQISIELSRPALTRSTEPQLIYILLDLCTENLSEKVKITPSHFCLVLDRSTSMQGERMDMVKSSALRFFRQLRQEDWVSVVIFNDRAEVLIPPTQVAEISKVENRISLVKTGGGTEIFQGLRSGFEQLEMHVGTKTVKELILLTDGHTYGDEGQCLALSEEAAKAGMTITTIGIGDEWNDALLDQLATNTGGQSFFIQYDTELSNIFREKISSLKQLFAKRLRLSYTLGQGVEMRYGFRVSPESMPVPIESQLQLGNLYHQSHHQLLFELLLSKIEEKVDDIKVLKGRIWMDIVGKGESSASIPVEVSLPVQAVVQSNSVPAHIKDALSKLSLYRMQEKARGEVSEGKVDQAMRHLQYLATNLLEIGQRDLAQSVLREAEHVQRSREFSQGGSKTIKYGTRGLFLPSGLEPEK